MSHSGTKLNSLDIFRASPVRGQLESYDPRTPKGARYIQTTDTPNEFKVLLPPATASMYEQLLKLENYELSKKPISWERIMEIRHLKDRMIRKCQKLAKSVVPSVKASKSGSFRFRSFVAPADFRVKEMERWFKDQQQKSSIPFKNPSPLVIPLASGSRQRCRSFSSQPMQRSITFPESSTRREELLYTHTQAQPNSLAQSEQPHFGSSGNSEGLSNLFSPPPLPVLILAQREDYGLGRKGEQKHANPAFASDPQKSAGEDDPDSRSDANLRRTPSRKPSLKRNSVTEMKTVSWADDRDLDEQLSKYASAAREAHTSGKWEEVRALYLEQINGLENLHLQVKEGLDHLHSETDHLQRIDDTIRKQREALDNTFQEFQKKHTLFQEKIHEALTEANDALV